MSLIKCPECNHQISDKAPYCILCGFPITHSGSDMENSVSIAAVAYNGNIDETNNPISFTENNNSWNVELLNIEKKKYWLSKVRSNCFI